MQTIVELTEYVKEKARLYWEETGDNLETFPSVIVDFLIEATISGCHFPNQYKENDIVSMLEKNKTLMAYECAKIFAKSGIEGQISHSENGISRTYVSETISPDYWSHFPNYVQIL